MKVDRVIYSKLFPLGQFTNEKIGVEIQVDEHDNIVMVLDHAKGIVEGYHKATNPGLYLELNPELYNIPSTGTISHVQPMPSIDRKAVDELEIKIDNAKSLDELLLMRTEILKYGLIKSYDNKLRQLQ